MAAKNGAGSGLRLRSQIWFIPLMCLVGATVLAFVTTSIDRRLSGNGSFQELFARNPEAVRTALSVVATSILTFTALVFTITMVVVQQAANRLTPRVIPTFLADRLSQATLGLFMGTFAFALLVLRDVRSPSEGATFVPGFSVALVFVAVLVSLVVFVSYLHHIIESLQVSHIADRIVDETTTAIDSVHPKDSDDPVGLDEIDGDLEEISWKGKPGVLSGVDAAGLLGRSGGGVIHVLRQQGEYVPVDSAIAMRSRNIDLDDLGQFIETTSKRSITSDVGFGLRKLVDIAEKALSPGINDPTTATEVLDRIHTLLRVLVDRQISSPRVLVADDGSRLVLASPSFADYLALATEEISQYGSSSIQVGQRMVAMLHDLITAASGEKEAELRKCLEEIVSATEFGERFSEDLNVVSRKAAPA